MPRTLVEIDPCGLVGDGQIVFTRRFDYYSPDLAGASAAKRNADGCSPEMRRWMLSMCWQQGLVAQTLSYIGGKSIGWYIWTCKDFSRFGSGMRLCGKTVPYLIILIKMVRQTRPACFIHENILEFPLETLTDHLSGIGLWVVSSIVSWCWKRASHVCSGPMFSVDSTWSDLYFISFSDISPYNNCGVPVQRHRGYVLLILKSRITQVMPLPDVVQLLNLPTPQATLDVFLVHTSPPQLALCDGKKKRLLIWLSEKGFPKLVVVTVHPLALSQLQPGDSTKWQEVDLRKSRL